MGAILETKFQHIVNKEGIEREKDRRGKWYKEEEDQKDRMIEEIKEHVTDIGEVTELKQYFNLEVK